MAILISFRQSLLAPYPTWMRRFSILMALAGLAAMFIPGDALLSSLIFVGTGTVLLMAGLYTWRVNPQGLSKEQRKQWLFLWLMVLAGVAAYVRNFITTPKIQGRFLFPSAGPIVTLIVYGWSVLLPNQRSKLTLILILAFMFWLNMTMWFQQVIPIFYQPFLD